VGWHRQKGSASELNLQVSRRPSECLGEDDVICLSQIERDLSVTQYHMQRFGWK
jgi:hypothetical protein